MHDSSFPTALDNRIQISIIIRPGILHKRSSGAQHVLGPSKAAGQRRGSATSMCGNDLNLDETDLDLA